MIIFYRVYTVERIIIAIGTYNGQQGTGKGPWRGQRRVEKRQKSNATKISTCGYTQIYCVILYVIGQNCIVIIFLYNGKIIKHRVRKAKHCRPATARFLVYLLYFIGTPHEKPAPPVVKCIIIITLSYYDLKAIYYNISF